MGNQGKILSLLNSLSNLDITSLHLGNTTYAYADDGM